MSCFIRFTIDLLLSKGLTTNVSTIYFLFPLAKRHPQSGRNGDSHDSMSVQEFLGQLGLTFHEICLGNTEPRNKRSLVQKNTHMLVRFFKTSGEMLGYGLF